MPLCKNYNWTVIYVGHFGSESIQRFFAAVLKLESVEECEAFFEDVCTIKEVENMASRLSVAFLLNEGKNYLEVTKATGVSTATISRVSKCLNYGPGGYGLAIERLSGKEE